MTELIGYIVEALGTAPAGCEPIQYIVGAIILLMLAMSAVNLVSGLFRWVGGL